MKFFKIVIFGAFFTCAMLLAEEAATQPKDPLEEQREWYANRKAAIEAQQRWLTEKHAMRLYRLKVKLEETKFDEVEEAERPAVLAKHNALLEAVRAEIKTLPAENVEYLVNFEKVENRLKEVIIPVVNFREAKIQDILEFFKDAHVILDGPKLPLLKFALIPPNNLPNPSWAENHYNHPINLSARETSLYIILNIVMDIKRMYYTVDDDTINIMPRFMGGDMFDHMVD